MEIVDLQMKESLKVDLNETSKRINTRIRQKKGQKQISVQDTQCFFLEFKIMMHVQAKHN